MDRLPPYDEAAEMAVIGCCITDPATCIPESSLVITTPEYFYDARCRSAWSEIVAMEPRQVNIITLREKIKNMSNVPAITFLSECQDAAFSTSNLPAWLELVQNKFTLRRIIKTAMDAAALAYDDGDAVTILDRYEREVLKIRPTQTERQDIKAILQDAQRIIEYRAQNWDKITGLSTGTKDLDMLSDGLHKGELIVVAALPSCGKTALAVNIAMHNALTGIPVGILSAEMRPVQLCIRSICSESRVNFKEITERDIMKMVPVMGRMAAAPIRIEKANGWTIGQATASARRLKQSDGIQLLVVDYIQRLNGVGDNRERQIASIGSGLKDIAMELEIPVIALSQLNDEGKLRESRAIGQDADSVWKLENKGAWQPKIQPITLKVEKCRDGETGQVDLTFFKTFTRFEQASKIQDEDIPPNRTTNDS